MVHGTDRLKWVLLVSDRMVELVVDVRDRWATVERSSESSSSSPSPYILVCVSVFLGVAIGR